MPIFLILVLNFWSTYVFCEEKSLVFDNASYKAIDRISSNSNPYLKVLLQEIDSKKLWEEDYWRVLLHYKPRFEKGGESEVDDLSFFFAKDGKENPKAEIKQTLAAFFDPPTDDNVKMHPQCRFPARYRWLKEKLKFTNKLPEQNCHRFKVWRERLGVKSATLVFASYYMGSPSSIFGHTFLRLNSNREKDLLEYGVNYAANVDTQNALFYAVKGVFGFFPGVFSLEPYSLKVMEYSNMESRDLWEYHLSLTEEEMDWFVYHLWEMGSTYMDYYFFTENCSYHLLAALEAARPSLNLTDPFKTAVIPVDTIKEIARVEGLITKTIYRPSLVSKVRYQRDQMSGEEKSAFYDVKQDYKLDKQTFNDLDSKSKARVLDALINYIGFYQYQDQKSYDGLKDEKRELLVERAKLDIQPISFENLTPPESPAQSHDSKLAYFGGGYWGERNEQVPGWYYTLGIQPSFHHILSDEVGFRPNSEIQLLTTEFRYFPTQEQIILDHFTLVKLMALSPMDRIQAPLSWQFETSVVNTKEESCSHCHELKIAGGYGPSLSLGITKNALFYTIAHLDVGFSDQYRNDVRTDAGLNSGFLLTPSSEWKVYLNGYHHWRMFYDHTTRFKVSLDQRLSLTRQSELLFSLSRYRNFDEAKINLGFYF